MTSEQMKGLKAGDTVIYDDGREGHRQIKAIVLTNGPHSVLVSFEDRADTTTIGHMEEAWTRFLLCAS